MGPTVAYWFGLRLRKPRAKAASPPLKRSPGVFVAASTRCFSDLGFSDALRQLVDLEYTAIEIVVHETGGHIRPSEVAGDLDAAIRACRQSHRLTVCAYSVDIEAPGQQYYDQFTACCKLAKATKVVTIVVRASELGTPFNEEVERLRKMAAIGSVEGVRVGLLTEVGRMTEDPNTAVVLCDSVKGLGLTLDPSHYIFGPHGGANFEQVMNYVYHVRLRDTKKDEFQVRVGQGEVEYGRLVNQLNKVHYDRALTVDVAPIPGVDYMAEMRKMRLLLETLI
jgi:sugar phosphate isomerase/epimerase